ncbi:MAG: lasso peptide biosynthesis B2 protein [Myxococcales bacterium]|nr:lasso peptide biosynthesis B2 protein [Myxococcales bacterium]MCB9520963.1 lasso peptide biosynthesis B2 protein [Myxococcales bacterium]MCB9532624.1 lasso peptide biosynthesis B2 protein [Myxococcales bacterium]
MEVEARLRSQPLDQCVAALDRGPSAPVLGAWAERDRVMRLTARLLRNRERPRTTCLHRALCRFRLLRELGFQPRFVMGVLPEGPLEGHAWIELDGAPVGEPEPPTYLPTFSYPAM